MKRSPHLLIACSLTLASTLLSAQIITTDPDLPTAPQAVTIHYDATQGTAGLEDYTGDVNAHTGVLIPTGNKVPGCFS